MMLYLEDYLEMIEHLPQELRDRFTEMREMDLQVQNSMDSLEKRVKVFFSNAKKMKPEEKEAEYEAIRKDYYKTLEDADEKVQLANHMHDLVSRYLRRLDQETHKFKMELEADHPGITEILEKRSQELDQPSSNISQKENRFSFTARSQHNERRSELSADHKRIMNVEKLLPELRLAASVPQPVPPVVNVPSATPAPVNYSLGHMGAGGTAIAAAASQAIAATQQMQQGRRTASLKASYEAIHSAAGGATGVGSGSTGAHELSISKELAGAAQTAIAAIQDTNKKQKKKTSIAASNTAMTIPAVPLPVPAPLPSPNEPSTSERPDSSYDPNEPRYCICNEVAFGDMVACDSKTCPYEWFHYQCVGITDPPKGKWYCPQCNAAIKRRGSRKTGPKTNIRDTL